jgi:hypothetical protein
MIDEVIEEHLRMIKKNGEMSKAEIINLIDIIWSED